MKVELLLSRRTHEGLLNPEKENLMEKDKQKPEPSKEAPGPSQEPTPRKTGRKFTEDRLPYSGTDWETVRRRVATNVTLFQFGSHICGRSAI
jgi:hypothetical protein